MSSIYLFNIASQRSHWLAVRQETVSSNIAHANTPGYAARDVQPFEAVLQSSHLAMATSDPSHVADQTRGLEGVQEAEEDSWQTYSSGNTVSIEKELVKAGEVNGAFALNNSVVKSFHRMLLASAKG
jgi:flagellar basal-body rod protein FlgB